MIPLELLNSCSKSKMASETDDELEIQQVDGRKNYRGTCFECQQNTFYKNIKAEICEILRLIF